MAPPHEPDNPFATCPKIGTVVEFSIAAGDSAIVEFPWYLSWYPLPCWPNSVGVKVTTANDPLNGSGLVPMDNNLAMCTGKQLYCKAGSPPRKSQVADKLAALSGESVTVGGDREDPPEPALLNVPVNNPYDMPREMVVEIVEPELPPGWMFELFAEGYGFVPSPWFVLMDPLQVIDLQVTVYPDPLAGHGETGYITLNQYLIETYPFEPIGGMALPIEVDLYEPMPVPVLAAQVIEEDPCIPETRSVLLSWEHPVFDVSGIPEPMSFFVLRDTILGAPPEDHELVGFSVCDANPETPEWDWIDLESPLPPTGKEYYYSVIAVDQAGNESEISAEVCCERNFDYVDIENGALRLTVTDQGILGYMEAGGRGSGLQAPPGALSTLFTGGFWAGDSPSYVGSRDFTADPDPDWFVCSDPTGYVEPYPGFPVDWLPDLALSDGMVITAYDDAYSSQSRGWLVGQASVAYPDPPFDRFALLFYRFSNLGEVAADGLYLGEYLDLDIGEFTLNWGDTDYDRQMVYMYEDMAAQHVGLRLLGAEPANLSLVRNDEFVYDLAYILDEDQFGFLSASAPEYQVPTAWEAADWSIMASAGPYHLAPGDRVTVAFAVVVGEGLPDLQMNADLALERYLSVINTEAPEQPVIPSQLTLLPNVPNPFNPATEIFYSLPEAGDVKVEVFDLRGRLVETLFEGRQDAGPQRLSWSADELSSGIYLLRVQTDDDFKSRKMALIK